MFLCLCLIVLTPANWQLMPVDSDASFRGIATRGEIICVAGANPEGPVVLLSTDSGVNWKEITPAFEEVSDYRCVSIADENAILLASAGSPAIIARTEDLGGSWDVVFRDGDPAAFIDSLRSVGGGEFWAFGDPVARQFMILRSESGGRVWNRVNCTIEAEPGEAGFAASNGLITRIENGGIAIALGGGDERRNSRILRLADGKQWQVTQVPILPAGPSSGIFAVEFNQAGKGVAVGGDYQQPESANGVLAVSEDWGRSWRQPKGTGPRGYRSTVIFVPSRSQSGRSGFWMTAGPLGSEISLDGEHWIPLGQQGFHALTATDDGRVLAAGSEGQVAQLDVASVENLLP